MLLVVSFFSTDVINFFTLSLYILTALEQQCKMFTVWCETAQLKWRPYVFVLSLSCNRWQKVLILCEKYVLLRCRALIKWVIWIEMEAKGQVPIAWTSILCEETVGMLWENYFNHKCLQLFNSITSFRYLLLHLYILTVWFRRI